MTYNLFYLAAAGVGAAASVLWATGLGDRTDRTTVLLNLAACVLVTAYFLSRGLQ